MNTNPWENSSFQIWEQKGEPTSILTYQDQLYICISNPSSLFISSTQNKKMKEILSFHSPYGIDFDEEKKLFYIIDNENVSILSLALDILFCWELPTKWKMYRGIKNNKNICFLTFEKLHQIYLCNNQNGKILGKWGHSNGGSAHEVFNEPRGITFNNKYAYICDSSNHRCQILLVENGKFFKQWGEDEEYSRQFTYPHSIYYNLLEEIFYIGDWESVQLWRRKDGVCIQTIRAHGVRSVGIIDDRLYVLEKVDKRISIFKRTP